MYKSQREPIKDDDFSSSEPLFGVVSKSNVASPSQAVVYLTNCGQVVRTLPSWKAPDDVIPQGKLSLSQTANFRLFQTEKSLQSKIFKFYENGRMFPKQIENTEGKGEIAL